MNPTKNIAKSLVSTKDMSPQYCATHTVEDLATGRCCAFTPSLSGLKARSTLSYIHFHFVQHIKNGKKFTQTM